MALGWCVAQTKPNAERQVRRRLRDQLFAAYLPLLTVRRAVLGRMVERQVPLFPGYLFVEIDLDAERWKAVTNTRGMLALLPTSERPISVTPQVIDDLRTAEYGGLFKRGVVRPGERVRVFRGTLVDQVLECIETNGDRLKLLWVCLGAPRVVYARISDVTVLS